jgi:hypothetical protein
VYTAFWLAVWLALAGAIVARGTVRVFCIGSFVFAFGYWLVGFEHTSEQPSPPITVVRRWLVLSQPSTAVVAQSRGDRLLTSVFLDWLEPSLRPVLKRGSKVIAQYNGGGYYAGAIQSFDGAHYTVVWDDGTAPSPVPPAGVQKHFVYLRTSAHSVLGLVLALAGGFATRWLFARRDAADGGRGA